jgi:CDGSH-type Zn-finger protein/uncharacterized Fe-S cluster protein YjdI
MAVETVRGSEVTVTFDGSRCIHARRCVLGLPDVFVPGAKGGWIQPDAAPAEAVLHIGRVCPSGAIRVTRNDGAGDAQGAPAVNTLRVFENGPNAIEAELTLRGEPQASPRAVLCRCGASANKPWCDGSHAAAGFAATGEPAPRESQPLEVRGGPVDLVPQENGPLMVAGNLEIVTGTGRTINRVRKVFLCRCGQSKSKPYCDGSHKAAGFIAPA